MPTITAQDHYETAPPRLDYDDETGAHWCRVCGSAAEPSGQSYETGATRYRCSATGVTIGISGL